MNQAFFLNIFVCIVGLALHFSMKWAEARNAILVVDERPGALDYILSVPAQTSIAALSTVGAFTVGASMEWMNPGMAFASGYMGHSIAENMANRFFKQLPT